MLIPEVKDTFFAICDAVGEQIYIFHNQRLRHHKTSSNLIKKECYQR